MRRLLLVAMMCGAVTGASAADMPDFLRGSYTEGLSKSSVNWAGVYLGGQAGRSVSDMNFTNSGQDLLAQLLNNVDLESQFSISKWPLLGTSHGQTTGYGGFVGYNFQWSEVLIGLELNYTHGNLFGSSAGSQTRVFSYPTDYMSTATAASSASMRITDYGSLRVRGGYAFDRYLPYAFAGIALGQANINRDASVGTYYQYIGSAVPAKPNIGPSFGTLSDNANSHFISGLAAGVGIDVQLYEGLFLRAEYEFLRFSSSNNTTVNVDVNSVHAGVGYKF